MDLMEMLEAIKNKNGLNWNGLAGKVGVSPITLHTWRKGSFKPNGSSLARVEAAYKDATSGTEGGGCHGGCSGKRVGRLVRIAMANMTIEITID